MNKLNVLWISIKPLSFPLNEALIEKYNSLSKYFNVNVIYISLNNNFEHHSFNNARFYSIPKLGRLIYVFPIYFLLLFLYVPFLNFKKNINVLIASDPFIPGIIASFWKRILFFKRTRLLVEAFGNWIRTPTDPLPKMFRNIVKSIIIMASKFSINSADALRAESQLTLALLKKYNNKAASKVFNDLYYIELFRKWKINKISHKKEFHILFVGRIVKLKGLQYVLLALSNIIKKHSEIKLLIAGSGEYIQEIKKQTNTLNLSNNVIFLGELSQSKVKEYIYNSDLVVLTSMSEGTPKILIEAMVMQKPIIASNVGNIPSIVEDKLNGFLVAPRDIKSIEKRLLWCLNNKNKLAELGIKGNKKIIEKFESQLSIKNYIKKYVEIINIA